MKTKIIILIALIPVMGLTQKVDNGMPLDINGEKSGAIKQQQTQVRPTVSNTKEKGGLSDGSLQGAKMKVVPLSTNNINSKSFQIRVIPDSIKSSITVDGIDGVFVLKVLDPLGQKIESKKAKESCIMDFEKYESGFYSLQILINDKEVGRYQIVKKD